MAGTAVRTLRTRRRGVNPKPSSQRSTKSNLPGEAFPDAGNAYPPPTHLPAHGKDLWKRLVKELHKVGLLTSVDWELFAAMCQSYADYREATEIVNNMTKKEKIVQMPGVPPHPHPWLKQKAEAEKRYHTLACEFGCSPAARSRIKTKPAKKTTGSLAKFRQGRSAEQEEAA